MLYSPEIFLNQIVYPTLSELELRDAELAICLTAIALHPQVHHEDSFGIYQISQGQHRQVWDQQLARDPDLASRVRGLASQHRFLRDPDQELTLNPCYATAIAVHLLIPEASLSHTDDFQNLGRRWCHLNQLPEQPMLQQADQLRLRLNT